MAKERNVIRPKEKKIALLKVILLATAISKLLLRKNNVQSYEISCLVLNT